MSMAEYNCNAYKLPVYKGIQFRAGVLSASETCSPPVYKFTLSRRETEQPARRYEVSVRTELNLYLLVLISLLQSLVIQARYYA